MTRRTRKRLAVVPYLRGGRGHKETLFLTRNKKPSLLRNSESFHELRRAVLQAHLPVPHLRWLTYGLSVSIFKAPLLLIATELRFLFYSQSSTPSRYVFLSRPFERVPEPKWRVTRTTLRRKRSTFLVSFLVTTSELSMI
jgi:hypothetical protein